MNFGGLDGWTGRAKDLIVLIPAAHVFCCFLYLFFFYYSFGNGLIHFASPTEVFSVSLAKVAPLYLFGGAGLIFARWTYETDDEIDERYTERGARVAKVLKETQHWASLSIPHRLSNWPSGFDHWSVYFLVYDWLSASTYFYH